MRVFAPQSADKDTSSFRHQTVLSQPLPTPIPFFSTSHSNGVLLQRKSNCACGGGCPSCFDGEHTSNIQTKLEVSTPGDQYEQEADRVAERVMRMPATGPSQPRPGFIKHQDSVATLRSPGQRLDAAARAFMEPRFGQDFSEVRIHTDSLAAQSARDLGAVAFTTGRDIVFGAGEFAPETSRGRRLLAHELTHVLQQSAPGAARSIQRQLFPPVPIIVNPGTPAAAPVEINAVDARQETSLPWYAPWRYTGPVAGALRGDVTMTNVVSMVNNVIAILHGRIIDRLNILDHGNAHGLEIGSDWLASAADVATHAGTLGRLGTHFASGAFVHMQNCRSGQNRALICSLARAFGVPVYAGTGLHNPLLGFNLGDYVRCEPGGGFNPDAGRPSTPRRPPPDTMA